LGESGLLQYSFGSLSSGIRTNVLLRTRIQGTTDILSRILAKIRKYV
jgi:hypothetical protein